MSQRAMCVIVHIAQAQGSLHAWAVLIVGELRRDRRSVLNGNLASMRHLINRDARIATGPIPATNQFEDWDARFSKQKPLDRA